MQLQYVCSVCGYHHARLRSLQAHLAAKKWQATHPLGSDTPYARVEMATRGTCSCCFCKASRVDVHQASGNGEADEQAPAAAHVSTDAASDATTEIASDTVAHDAPPSPHIFMTKSDDRSVLVDNISRAFENLKMMIETLHTWTPAYVFLSEPLPSIKTLAPKLCDMLSGPDGMVAHALWTHVHSSGTVRKLTAGSEADVLMIYGQHGWTPVSALKVAEQAYDNLAIRVQRMWFALESVDERSLNTVRVAMRAFLEGGPCVDVDPMVYGMSDITRSNVSPAAKDFVIGRIRVGLVACCS